MEINKIFESGFIKAFIAEYFELKIHSYYPEKHRLLYVLCNNDEEKQLVTAKQIELVKSEIQKLGNEELSFGYLFSCKPEYISGTDYVEPANRFKHWLNIFSKEYQNNTDTFLPILNSINNLKNDFGNEDFEAEFWEIYPNNKKPKESSLVYIIQREADLLSEIEFAILEFRKNEVWEIDFEEFKKFVEISKPIEDLFNLSELLVQLNLLEMFNEFLLSPQKNKTKTEKIKAPVLGLFCNLINKIGIDKKEETESASNYCKRICDKFKLPYTDRVRQNYNVNETKSHIKELTEKVLPLINEETKISIQKYLDNKQPPKQILYA
jgi:hypothetical protein